MKTFVFCGQGSQVVGMGKEYFDQFPELVKEADEILGYSIEELCLSDPYNRLNLTQYTQPALYVVSMLEYYDKIKYESEPDFVIGHSAGEYAALCAAGAFSFKDGLKIVKERGRLMAEQEGGGMAAVIGLDQSQVEHIIEKYNLDSVDIANLNTEKQIVISAPIDDIKKCESIFLSEGARTYVVLKVSGAFHSRYMLKAQEQMKKYIDDITINDMNKIVISNYTARPYEKGKVKNTLIPQMSNSVKWLESVRYLMSYDGMDFIKIGPGANTINMVKRIVKEAEPLSEYEKEQNKTIVEIDKKIDKEKEVNIKNMCVKLQYTYKEDELDEGLGSLDFRKKYHTKYSYIVGSMGRGISGAAMVANACNNGILSFIGTEGLNIEKISIMIDETRRLVKNDTLFGINITQDYFDRDRSNSLLDLCLKKNIRVVEINNFMSITKELVKYRIKGIKINSKGQVEGNSIIAKTSQIALIKEFMQPAPDEILKNLLDENEISLTEYELARKIPIIDDICLMGDCAYETERANLISLLAESISIREKIRCKQDNNLLFLSRLGCAGGIGTPLIVATYFYMGADFILTGSINQCSKDAVLSKTIKNFLSQLSSGDCTYVPSEKFFELNKSVQVVKKGLFFPSRANLLKSLYEVNDSLDAINDNMKTYIKNKIFHMNLEEYYEKIKTGLNKKQLLLADANPKYKMALIFKKYFTKAITETTNISHENNNIVDCEIYCSSALGAFNEDVKGTELEDWNNRNVVNIADYLMMGAKKIIENKTYII